MGGYRNKHLLILSHCYQKTQTIKFHKMKYHFILFLLFAALFSCSENKFHKKDETKDPPVKYKFATVEKEPLATTIKLPAQLAAYEEVSIFPKVNGYVKTVQVDIGSKVSRGELLMMLEAPELEQVSLQAKEK